MTAPDPFLYADAAYVLGALDEHDRREFEAHLAGCADCRARVDDARATTALLAAVPRDTPAELWDAIEPVPDTLLPSLLRAARKERTRRRWLTTAVGSVAAACLIALAVVLWPGGGGSTGGSAPQAFAPVRPSPLTATARLVSRDWGTEIDLHCTYPGADNYRFAYNLVVIDAQNRAHDAGDWTLVPGQNGIDFQGGTSVTKADITKLQITTSSGVPVLELQR